MNLHITEDGSDFTLDDFLTKIGGSEILSNPVSLSKWQEISNILFYQRKDNAPLSHFQTLGGIEPILPMAMAKEFLSYWENKPKSIHEIGPGNFNFAVNFNRYLKNQNEEVEYLAHDFSDSNHAIYSDKLKEFGNRIKFKENSIQDFHKKVNDDPLQIILVEVLDDIKTDFFRKKNGLEEIIFLSLGLREKQSFQSIIDLDKKYLSQEIIDLINDGNWDELQNIDPKFLESVNMPNDDSKYIRMPVEDYLLSSYFFDKSDEFKKYAFKVTDFFKSQLDECVNEHQIIHFPIDGINFLWNLRNRENLKVDFFDYGYDSIKSFIKPVKVYSGQVTAPVNFDLLRYAGEVLGFNSTLETNREFIKRNMGEDTIPVGYIQKAVKEAKSIPEYRHNDLLSNSFEEQIKILNQGVEIDMSKFLSYRIRRDEYYKFEQALKEKGGLRKDFEMSEGSFHLSISR